MCCELQRAGEAADAACCVRVLASIVHLFFTTHLRCNMVAAADCCTAAAVQVLAMTTRDIDVLIRLWSKFKFGVDEQGPC